MVDQIKSSIADAINKINVEKGIPLKDVIIHIKKKGVRLNYSILNKHTLVEQTSLDKLIGGKRSIIAGIPLYNAVKQLIRSKNLDDSTASLLLYLKTDQTPSAYLYNNGQPLEPIEIENLIN